MADLPKCRVPARRPFLQVGIDFGGPLFIKSSRLRKATKAIDIELVSGLSTKAFLLTFKRFISRRGCPSIIHSDNATNFVGSRNQLRDLYTFFKTKQNAKTIQNFLSMREIQWKFIPAKSPHWGGL